MLLNEADTRAKLIDPAIHKCGWTEDLLRREETAGQLGRDFALALLEMGYHLSLDFRPAGKSKVQGVKTVGEFIQADNYRERWDGLGIQPVKT
jgi:hypothetical protein